LIFVGAFCALLLAVLPFQRANCLDYIEYKIKVDPNDSAEWSITKVSDINVSIDVEGFQQRIEELIDAAVNATGREMILDGNSLQVSDEISWETRSRTTVYMFTWQNFSVTDEGKITFGDVFHTAGFFSQLYGEGAIQITYPPSYSIQSISPAPNERDDSAKTFRWFRTQDFVNGEPSITLTNNPQSGDGGWQQYAVVALILVIAVVASLVGFYMVRRRKPKAATNVATPAGVLTEESDEEKVIKLIRSSGGSIYQSDVAEQFRFSKAKTSQLLASLEKKGVITRYKRGRDKIVTLNERAAGDKS
jgi:hypothetical protein